MHIYYAFGNHIYTFLYVPHMYYLFGRHISYSLFMPINLNITHTCIYTQYLCLLGVKWHLQIFSFHSYICSFISMITYVFFDWKTYYQKLHSACVYICICVCAHTYIHSCSSAYIHPSMHICLPTSIHPYIHTESCMYVYIHAYIHV